MASALACLDAAVDAWARCGGQSRIEDLNDQAVAPSASTAEGMSRNAGRYRPAGMTKFLLIQHQAAMGTWAPADVRRHFDYQRSLDDELAAAGELVEAQGLGGRTHRVAGEHVPGDGVLPALAGYRVVDVESEERALQIAAQVSAAPGPGGEPLRQQIDVRRLLTP